MITHSHSIFKLWFDRFLSKSLWKQFAVVFAFLILSLLLSYLILPIWSDSWENVCNTNNVNKWLLPIYLLIDSNALNNIYIDDSPQGTVVNAWTLIASTTSFLLGTFIFNGFIIAIITNSIERRVTNHKEGHIHYLKSGHYIIMGYDDLVPSFIKHIFNADAQTYILLLTSEPAVDVKEALMKSFSDKQMKKIIVNYGHRTTEETYKSIHLEAAQEVFIVGNQSHPAHDAINIECVDSICDYLEKQPKKTCVKRITCVFRDLDTYAVFKTSEIFDRVSNLDITFMPYNFYTAWARQVFVKRCQGDKLQNGYNYPSIYGAGITPDDPRFVHLVFVGTSNFAVAFAMEAAHVLHFPNFNHHPNLKTRITFIDLNADIEKDEFITRNRHFFEVQEYRYRDLTNGIVNDTDDCVDRQYVLFENKDANFLDVEFEFIKGNVFSKNVQDEIKKWATDKEGQYLSIFLTMKDQHCNFVIGMNMPDEIYEQGIPIFIRQDRSDNFVTKLRSQDNHELQYACIIDGQINKQKRKAKYANIYPFGMVETTYQPDNKSLKRAKLINYLYKKADYNLYHFVSLETLESTPINKIWEEANELWRKKDFGVALKWSNLYSSYSIRTQQATLRAMRGMNPNDVSHDTDMLSIEEIEEIARVEHNRWNVEKLLMGFRKPRKEEDKYAVKGTSYEGELEKNKKLFIHHDIRPYDKLGDIKKLDKDFSKYIPWIIWMSESGGSFFKNRKEVHNN